MLKIILTRETFFAYLNGILIGILEESRLPYLLEFRTEEYLYRPLLRIFYSEYLLEIQTAL